MSAAKRTSVSFARKASTQSAPIPPPKLVEDNDDKENSSTESDEEVFDEMDEELPLVTYTPGQLHFHVEGLRIAGIELFGSLGGELIKDRL